MKKLIGILVALSMLVSTTAFSVSAADTNAQTLQDFESYEVGDVELTIDEATDNCIVADNVTLTSDCWVFNKIVENQYGQTGKSLKVNSRKLFFTSTAQANYTTPLKLHIPKSLNPSSAWGASYNLYVPKLPENIRLRVRGCVSGSSNFDTLTYFYPDGTVRAANGSTFTQTALYSEGWNHIGLFNNPNNAIRFYVNGFATGKSSADGATFYPETGWNDIYFDIRYETIDGSTDYPVNLWYLIDDFKITDNGVIAKVGDDFTAAENQSLSVSDTKTVQELIDSLSLSSNVTAQAINIDEDGNTTVVDNTASVKNATHLMETSISGAKRMYKLAVTGSITLPEGVDYTTAGFDSDDHNRVVGKITKFTKVGALKQKLNTYASSEVTIITQNGNEATDDMLVNSTMKVAFKAPQYNGCEYTIQTKQNEYVNSDSTLADDTKVEMTGGTNSIAGVKNINGDGTVNTNINAYKTTIGNASGYKFTHDGTGTDNNILMRTDINPMDSSVTASGDKTVVEATIRPENSGWYVMHFRWYNEAQGKGASDNDIYSKQSNKTTGITFAPNGKIYLGGSGDRAYTMSTQANGWMDELCDYTVGQEYKIQLVIQTPKTTDTVFYICGVYVNGVKCGTYNDDGYITSHLNYAYNTAYQFSRLSEIDFDFWPSADADSKAYAVSVGGVNCYSSDNFVLDGYIPNDVTLPTAEYYDNDAFVGGKTVKTAQKTISEFLSGMQKDVSIYVTDKNGFVADNTSKLTDGMKLYVSSLDGRVNSKVYTYSSETDFGKLTVTDVDGNLVTYSKDIKNYDDSSKKISLYAAAYDSDGNLVECGKSESKTLTGCDEGNFTATLSKSNAENVEVFIWNDDSLMPYTDKICVNNGIVSNDTKSNSN